MSPLDRREKQDLEKGRWQGQDLGPDSHCRALPGLLAAILVRAHLRAGCLCSPKHLPLAQVGSLGIACGYTKTPKALRGLSEPGLLAMVPKWTPKGLPGLAEGCWGEAAQGQAEQSWEGFPSLVMHLSHMWHLLYLLACHPGIPHPCSKEALMASLSNLLPSISSRLTTPNCVSSPGGRAEHGSDAGSGAGCGLGWTHTCSHASPCTHTQLQTHTSVQKPVTRLHVIFYQIIHAMEL